MIKHIVMWRIQEPRQENALKIKAALEGLNGQIPGLLRLEVGVDVSREEDSADVVLYSEFASRQALEDYLGHPAHLAVVPLVKTLRMERRVADYQV